MLPLSTWATETYYFLQVATYANVAKKYAEAEVKRLRSLGLTECFVMPSKKFPYLYIRCGKAKNLQELKPIEEKLKKVGLSYRLVKVTYEDDPFKDTFSQNSSNFNVNTVTSELIKRAEFFEKNGDYKYALKLYKQALDITPNDSFLKKKIKELSQKISLWETPQGRKEVTSFYQKLDTVFDLIEKGELERARKLLFELEKKGFDEKAIDIAKATIEIKKGNYYKSCKIMSKYSQSQLNAKERRLKDEACYNYYLSYGYRNLQKKPLTAEKSFKKALLFKNSNDAKKGLALAYLKQKKFKLSYKLFKELWNRGNKSKEIAEGILYSLQGMKRFRDALKFYTSLLPSLKTKVKFDESFAQRQLQFEEIDSLIEEGALQEALLELQKLYLKEPENTEVLLRMGEIYLKLEEFAEAEQVYKEALVYDPDNIYAMEALLGILMVEKKYREALKVANELEKKGVKVEKKREIELLLKEEKLKDYVKLRDYTKAEKIALELVKERPADPYPYLVLGDIYASRKELKKAHRYYAKAYMMDRENFGIKLKFLYSLLNQNMFEQIRIILPTIDFEKLSPSQKEKLREFYVALYKKLASYYIKLKNYEQALAAAEEGLEMVPNDADLLSLKGWACLNLNNLDCAITNFKRSLAITDDTEVKYGLALAYVKKGIYKKAIPLMDEIERDRGKKYFVKLADLYLMMGKEEKAEELLRRFKKSTISASTVRESKFYKEKIYIPETIPELPSQHEKEIKSKKNKIIFNPFLKSTSFTPKENIENEKYVYGTNDKPNKTEIEEKDEYLLWEEYKKIKRKLTLLKDRHMDSISVGINTRFKSGESGKTRLGQASVFIDYENFLNPKFKLNIGGTLTALSSGTLSDYEKFGSYWSETPPKKIKTSFSGGYPYVALRYYGDPSFGLKVSSTPIGDSEVSPEVTGKFFLFKSFSNVKGLGIAFERTPIKDTLLSFVGSEDPYTSLWWGRVLKTGGKLFFKKKGDISIYLEGGFYSLEGENTQTNSLISFSGSLKKNIPPLFDSVMKNTVGIVLVTESFSEDNLYFSYGRGGYFSPKYFFLIGPEYDSFFYLLNEKLLMNIYALPSFITYGDKDSYKLTLGFDWKALFLYKLSPEWFLQGGFSFQNSYKYNDVRLNFGVRYFFGKRERLYLEDVEKLRRFILE